MTIEEFDGAVPSSTDPDNFDARADAAWAWLVGVVPQINETVATLNFASTTSTSGSSLSIGTGSKALNTQAGKSFFPGMWVIVSSVGGVTNFMVGQVTAYDSSSGGMDITVHFKNGSGAYSNWIIGIAAARNLETTTDEIILRAANGAGSTNTLVRKYTTIEIATGTSMTYENSASLGASITINESGIYAFTVIDNANFSIRRNSIAYDNSSAASLCLGTGIQNTSTVVVHCVATDVIRVVTSSLSGTTNTEAMFRAKRIL